MTEEEKQQERRFKATVAAQLQADRRIYPQRYKIALNDTDKRLGDYVFEVIDRPEAHNLYE